MPDLDKQYFAGGGDIPSDIAGQLTLHASSDRDRDILTNLGWEGQLIGYMGVSLSTDGKKVTGARFGIQGKLTTGAVELQAAKLWERVSRDVTVSGEVRSTGASSRKR
jgi:hypothetical protein